LAGLGFKNSDSHSLQEEKLKPFFLNSASLSKELQAGQEISSRFPSGKQFLESSDESLKYS
jgi:hypothetical protein